MPRTPLPGLLTTVALLLAATATPLRATTFVVPDDIATIQGALNAAQPGDTVSVKDTAGPYFEKLTFPRSGTPGAYITLQAYTGHQPTLDGTGVAGPNMMHLVSRSYVKVVGFEIRNNLNVNDGSGIRIEGSGSFVEVRNNRIHDMRGNHAMGITVYGTAATSISNLVIDGNEIYDCEPAHSEALTLNGNVELFEVTNNIVRDVDNIGIDFIGGETDIQPDPAKVARNGVCRGNQVYRARSSYGGGYAGGIYVDGGKDIVIERNVVSECDLGIEIGAENNGIVASGIVVRNNFIYRNDKAGLVFGGYDASVGRVRDSAFLNNTLFQNDTLGTGIGEIWIQFADTNVIRNNVAYSTGQNVLLYSENGNVDNTLDYNLWFVEAGAGAATFVWRNTVYTGFAAYQTGSGQDAHGLFADPQLVAPAGGNLHIRSTSPAVDAGDPAFVPGAGETDIDGAVRISGGQVDLGADEVTCGDGWIDTGETCDDGNLVDCDGCDSNCTPSATCGNGVLCAPEACDDGNTAAGDCCSPTCTFELAGNPCNDGTLCTRSDACNGSGTCVGVAQPEPVCRTATVAGGSRLTLLDKTPDSRDAFSWTWMRGAATTPAALGDPTGATVFDLCIYDQSAGPQPRLDVSLPAGGICASRACWSATGTGFRYSDRNRTWGVRLLRLTAGDSGKARISLRGGSAAVTLPALAGVVAPVTVQLRNSLGECWGASYSALQTQTSTQLKARSD